MVEMIGYTSDTQEQNEINEENMKSVLLVMELSRNAILHMHGIFKEIF